MSQINIKLCEVISVDDEFNSGRIKVRLYPDDKGQSIDKLPYAFPLLPKMFNLFPKVGEAVIVFLTESGNGNSNRYYIGPVISQLPNLEYDGFHAGAFSNYNDSFIKPNPDFTKINTAIGAFGDKDDVSIYGRKGTDIILKENDIRIRAGARIDGDNVVGKTFNRLNPAYLKLKYSDVPLTIENYDPQTLKTNVVKSWNSSATLVADEINLISNTSNRNFITTDEKELISDEEMKKIILNAHVLPYGDVLVQFLKRFLWEFQNHTHTFPGKLTALYAGHEDFFNYDFEPMLSKNVRIN